MQTTKTALLALLKSGDFVSGEALAEEIGVSRTAIWKNIQKLKDQGYNIVAVHNKGYSLLESSKELNETTLKSLIESSQLFDQVVYKEVVDSTQNYAFNILNQSDDNIVIVSQEQTKGRGRFKREWESPKSTGLYMSLVLRPDIPNHKMIPFNLFISLAISKAIQKVTGLDAGIKWPNDIYINNKKVCGFLTEIVAEENTVSSIICGIGINIKPSNEISKLATATSLLGELKDKDFDLVHFIDVLFQHIEIYYNMFMTKNFKVIKDEWLSHSIIFKRKLKVTQSSGVIYGKVLDITDDGQLLIVDEEANIHKVISADIEI